MITYIDMTMAVGIMEIAIEMNLSKSILIPKGLNHELNAHSSRQRSLGQIKG